MRQQRSLRIDNFRLAQRRDGALRQDKLFSMRTLENFDVIYTDGRLRVRPGYTRWNDTALPAVATQLFYFVPLDSPDSAHLLGISNSRWYGISEVGAHNLLKNEAATARRPVLTVGERCFFGTDTGWYWTDNSSIGGATKSYRVGIKKPTVAPALARTPEAGPRVAVIPGARIWLNTTDQRRFAAKMVLGSATKIGSMRMCISKPSAVTPDGNVVLKIFTDNAGTPSTTLADPNLVSWPWPVANLAVNFAGGINANTKVFQFPEVVELAAGTYWVVLEADAEYRTNYSIAPAAEFYCDILYDQPGVPDWGYAKWWNAVTTSWDATNYEPHLLIGGLNATYWYDYVFTYFNTTYLSESRPSVRERVKPIVTERSVVVSGLTASADPQVDKVRIYRRQVTNADDMDEDIADAYKFVAEVNEAASYTDYATTDDLGAELQTQNHYAWDDVDDTNEKLRDTAVLPAIHVLWKDRVWLATGTDNKLWFTKTLEQDGATGLTNDPIYDYIPLENVREIPCPSRIMALAVLPQDQLAVFFENEAIWIVWGANESLNPPADIAFRELMPKGGLIAAAGLDESKRGLYFLSRDGMYVLPGLEYMTETNQSILDAIENDYIAASRVLTFGNEVWLLIDSDNDGTLDTVLILDMQRDIPTRQLFDRAWKMYSYNVGLNDIVVKQKGGAARTILAADSVNFYILELGDGVNDNGSAIVAEVESHDLRARNMAMIFEVDIDAVYSGNPPAYTLTLTDHMGGTQVYTRTPASSDDIRLHRIGCRFNQPVSMRTKLSMSALAAHELLSLEILYVRD